MKRQFYGIGSILLLLVLGIAAVSFGLETTTSTLTSDKDEYFWEETAKFEGFGFNKDESVAIRITSDTESISQKIVAQGNTIASGEKVKADTNGKIAFDWKACDCGKEKHLVVATGDTSGKTAQKEVKVNPQCESCVGSEKADNIPASDDIPRVVVDGVATIGTGKEWKPGDLFAHMYVGGNQNEKKVPTSDAYVVFYCSEDKKLATVSVLVKTISPYTIVQDSKCGDNNWIKYCVDGKATKLVDSCNTNFKYVVEGTKTVGYEASFSISPGDYKVQIHAAVVDDKGNTETSAIDGHPAGVCMLIDCDKGGETAVELASFTAVSAGGGKVSLHWETATEVDNAGFNIYRSKFPDGTYKKINNGLIPAPGNATTGATYSFEDTPGRGTFYYKLEDVDFYAESTMHGPEKVRIRAKDLAARKAKGR